MTKAKEAALGAIQLDNTLYTGVTERPNASAGFITRPSVRGGVKIDHGRPLKRWLVAE
jgi:hypothetical protein